MRSGMAGAPQEQDPATPALLSVSDGCAPQKVPDALMATTGLSGRYEAQGPHSLCCWCQNSWKQLCSGSARACGYTLSCLFLGWLSCW